MLLLAELPCKCRQRSPRVLHSRITADFDLFGYVAALLLRMLAAFASALLAASLANAQSLGTEDALACTSARRHLIHPPYCAAKAAALKLTSASTPVQLLQSSRSTGATGGGRIRS